MDELLEAVSEMIETIYQMPLSEKVLLSKAMENATTLFEIAPEYLRLRNEEAKASE